jgi:hypothetical protein
MTTARVTNAIARDLVTGAPFDTWHSLDHAFTETAMVGAQMSF